MRYNRKKRKTTEPKDQNTTGHNRDRKMETKQRKNKKRGKYLKLERCRNRKNGLEGKGPSSSWARTETKLTPLGPQLSWAFRRRSAAEKEKPLLPHSNEFDIQSMKINSPKVRGFLHLP